MKIRIGKTLIKAYRRSDLFKDFGRKDISHLVPKIVPVTREGHTFNMTVWVDPVEEEKALKQHLKEQKYQEHSAELARKQENEQRRVNRAKDYLSQGKTAEYEARRSSMRSFRGGRVGITEAVMDGYPVTSGKDHYVFIGRVSSKSLKPGDIIGATYKATNEGADVYEFIGFSGTEKEYGEGGKKYNTLKEVFESEGVHSNKELEEKQDKNKYGNETYMIVKDLETGEQGPWFYLFKGRWSRGSGAEALTFWKVQKV